MRNNIDKIFILYLIYFLLQIVGLAQLDKDYITLERTFLVILALNGIAILHLAYINFNIKGLIIFFYINILFLILISIIYTPIIIKDYFQSPNIFLYGSETWSQSFIDDPVIRVTGLARVLSLIFLILIFKLCNTKFNKISVIYFILLAIIGGLIWGLQSRLTLGILGISIVIFLSIFSYKKFKQNLSIILVILLMSHLCFNEIYKYKEKFINEAESDAIKKYDKVDLLNIYAINKKHKKNRIKESIDRLIIDLKNTEKNEKKYVVGTTTYITSARNLIWSKIVNTYDYKKIFGYGPQADRFVLLKEDKNDNSSSGYMTNASSSLFYAFICSGYFGLLIFVLINLNVLHVLITFLKYKIHLEKNHYFFNSIFLIIIFTGGRSFAENSHAVFSLDFLIFISGTIILKKIINEKTKKII